MPASMLDLILVAQSKAATVEPVPLWYEQWYGQLIILVGIFTIPWFIGRALSRWLRMPTYSWKIALILFASLAAGVVISLGTFKLGYDLAGGISLIYEIDQEKKELVQEGETDLMGKLITAISQRIDPAGVMQVTIRKYGEEQIEIIIPEVNDDEVKQIKRRISTAGNLEFRILADSQINEDLVTRALDAEGRFIRDETEDARRSNPAHQFWIDEALASSEEKISVDGRDRARWVAVPDGEIEATRKEEDDLVVKTRDDGKLVKLQIVGQLRAQWVRVGESERKPGDPRKFRVNSDQFTVQRPREDGGRDMLVAVDDLHVDGGYLTASRPGYRDGRICVDFSFNSRGAKKFGTLTQQNIPESGRKRRLGIVLDEELLSAPQLNTVIRESGQITGDFTEEEVNWLVGVLNAGRLPAALNKVPISEQKISPTLGQQTIDSGTRAIGFSIIAVLLFMPVYYRFCGIVASCALLLNLLLVLGVMMAIGAAFTLPGLAGLVLTVGMAVDANVLIFERIREEKDRGAALRMAIRNGFGRATRTIVDANLTTLITGLVLYVVGTDQIKGFAVTLILGIGMSMFTAIFCSRVIFDIAEKRRWITELSMGRILGKTNFDFIGKRHVAAVFSLAMITLGLVGVYMRGEELLDIDFRGGVRIETVFNDPQKDVDVYRSLADFSDQQAKESKLNDLRVVGFGDKSEQLQHQFIVETTQDKLPVVERAIKDVFGDKLKTNSLLSRSRPAAIDAAESNETAPESPTGPDDPVEKNGPDDSSDTKGGAEKPGTNDGARLDLPALSLVAQADEGPETESPATDADSGLGVEPEGGSKAGSVDAEAETAPSDPADTDGEDQADNDASSADAATAQPAEPTDGDSDVEKDSSDDVSGSQADEPPVTTAADSDSEPKTEPKEQEPTPTAPEQDGKSDVGDGADTPDTTTDSRRARFAGGSEVELTFAEAINQLTLGDMIQQIIEEQKLGSPDVEVSNPTVFGESVVRKPDWTLRTTLSVSDTQELLDALQASLVSAPLFPSSTNIGGQVAGDTQRQAFAALIASLVFIVAYIWVRFQRVSYGFAAVIALVHDVLITLGVLALSRYIAELPGVSEALLIEPFKISLPILAAFLTIIGYSLNDTIVVFDRIREVRGKSPELTEEMVNTSINQTLSRTLLTSVTTLIVVLILYFVGGPGIHGFAFALVVGVLVGTYSSIFIASPALLWMRRFSSAPGQARLAGKQATAAG